MRLRFMLLMLFLPTSAFALCYKPHTYQDCLLDGLKGVTSDAAATAIKQACSDKFPAKTKKNLMALSTEKARSLVTGELSSGFGSLSGRIHNGSWWHLVSVTVLIRPHAPPGSDAPAARRLEIDLSALPNTSGGFCIFIDKAFEEALKNGFVWSIEQLKVVPESPRLN